MFSYQPTGYNIWHLQCLDTINNGGSLGTAEIFYASLKVLQESTH